MLDAVSRSISRSINHCLLLLHHSPLLATESRVSDFMPKRILDLCSVVLSAPEDTLSMEDRYSVGGC